MAKTTKRISLFYPTILKREWLTGLGKVFNTRWLGQGPLVDKFEAKFGQKFGYKYCLGLNSGSAALELAYHLIGIRPGDEILTPVFTCTATNLPLLRRGARLKFLDINDQLLVDYADICRKVSPKTRAIVVVNLGGLQVDNRIFTLAKKLKIPVVVDACQSLGIAEKHGNYICYSFQAIKHFTTGDGGMLVVSNRQEYNRAKKLRWFGINRDLKRRAGWKTLVNHPMAQEIEEAGYKYHMTDIAAAMGMVGLKHSDRILKYRNQLCQEYIKGLPNYTKICGGAYWLFAVVSPNAQALIKYLRRNNIECDPVQLRNDIFKVFGGKKQPLPNMNRLESQYFYLPLHCNMTLTDVRHITKTISQWHTQKYHK